MRSLATLSGALSGLMMIIVGTLIPSAVIIPGQHLYPQLLSMPSTWQVPAVLISAIVCGSNGGVLASIAYITIGLVHLPVFHGGGAFVYLISPGFGYIAGFIPAAFVTGRLSQQDGMNNIISLTCTALVGLTLIQSCGVLNLLVGSLLSLWHEPLTQLLFTFSIAPLLSQICLCPAVAIISLVIRRLLFIE